MNQDLDQTTSRKRELQECRSMESLALEFSSIKVKDIIKYKEMFDKILQEKDTKEEFLNFLNQAEIPITRSDLIFPSVLTFIRDDQQMPRN